MQKIFLDFDNTIVESNKRIIEMLNERHHLNKTEEDLTDFLYTSIYKKVTNDEIRKLYGSKDFFYGLEFKENCLDVINKYKDKFEIIITTKGDEDNLFYKKEWIKENLGEDIYFLGLNGNPYDKKNINMNNGIQIDDNSSCLKTNAGVHILYKGNNNYSWQNNIENKNVLVVNTWQEIDDILNFYGAYDFKTLNKK